MMRKKVVDPINYLSNYPHYTVNEQLDAAAVKRMLLSFEKHVLRNQEMRIKFPDQPDKFMESELELNDEIQSLHIISTVPEHYPILVNTNIVQTLCGLLTHDNSDISIAVVDLLQELTDTDNEETLGLIDSLLEEKVSDGSLILIKYCKGGFEPKTT